MSVINVMNECDELEERERNGSSIALPNLNVHRNNKVTNEFSAVYILSMPCSSIQYSTQLLNYNETKSTML